MSVNNEGKNFITEQQKLEQQVYYLGSLLDAQHYTAVGLILSSIEQGVEPTANHVLDVLGILQIAKDVILKGGFE